MKNEKRLISAEQAYEIARLHHKDFALSMADLTSLREVLEDCDTVDARPVVHGRCDWCNGDYHTKIMATAIRYHSNGNMDGYEMKVKFCPNCGSQMDGGNEDG